MADTISISIQEFTQLQQQLLQFKEEAIDAKDKNKKLQAQVDNNNQKTQSGGSWFGSNSKAVVEELRQENENLKKSLKQHAEEFKEQTAALRQNLEDLYVENEQLKNTSTNAQTQLEEKISKEEEIKKLLTEKENEISKLIADFNEIREKKESLEKENSRLSTELSNRGPEISAELSEDDKVTEIRTLRENLNKQRESSEKKEELLEKEKENLRQELSKKIEELEKQYELLEKQLEVKEKARENAEKEKEIALKEKDLFEKEKEISEKQKVEAEKNKFDAEKQREIAEKQRELAEKEKEILHKEKETIEKQLKDLEKEKELKEKEKENIEKNLNSQLLIVTQERDEVKKQLSSFQEIKNSETLDLTKSIEEITIEFTKKIEDLTKKGEELTSTNTRLQRSNDSLKEQITMLKDEKDKQIEQLLNSNNYLSEKVQELTISSEDIKRDREKVGQELQAVLSEISAVGIKKIDSKFINSFKEENGALKNDLQNLQKKLTQSEKELENYKGEIAAINEKSGSFEEIVNLNSQKIKQLRDQVSDLTVQLEEKDKMLQFENNQFTNTFQESEEIKQALSKMTEKYLKIEGELNAMSIRKEEVATRSREAIEELKKNHSEEIEKLKEEINQSQVIYEQLEASTEDNLQLKNDLLSTNNLIEQLKEEISQLKTEIAQLKGEIDQVKEENEKIKEEKENLVSQANQLEENNQNLANQISEMEIQSKIEEKKSQRLIKDLQSQLQKARGDKPADNQNPPSPAVGLATAKSSIDLNHSLKVKNNANHVRRNSVGAPVNNNNNANVAVKTPSAGKSPLSESVTINSNISDDDLTTRLAELQKRNSQLDHYIRKLRAKIEQLEADNNKKSSIIQHHLCGLSIEGRSTAAMDTHKLKRATRESGIMGKLFGGGAADIESNLQLEINAKISRVLEDTILKNVQLQQDMELMGEEINKLDLERKELLKKFNELTKTDS